MIDKSKKILFIHIPKCAGTFISANITPGKKWNHWNGQHDSLERAIRRYRREDLRNYFVFTIVRNPFDRFASFYHFHLREGYRVFRVPFWLFGSPRHKDYMRDFDSFSEHLESKYDKLKPWAKRDLRPCHEFLRNDLGIDPVVYKLEEMESWIPELEKKTGTKFSSAPINAGKKQDYAQELNPEIKEFLKKFYKDDLQHYYPELKEEPLP